MAHYCEHCSSSDTVTRFTHFPDGDQEYLYWECHWPISEKSLHSE